MYLLTAKNISWVRKALLYGPKLEPLLALLFLYSAIFIRCSPLYGHVFIKMKTPAAS